VGWERGGEGGGQRRREEGHLIRDLRAIFQRQPPEQPRPMSSAQARHSHVGDRVAAAQVQTLQHRAEACHGLQVLVVGPTALAYAAEVEARDAAELAQDEMQLVRIGREDGQSETRHCTPVAVACTTQT
jgi:hypothetical protein